MFRMAHKLITGGLWGFAHYLINYYHKMFFVSQNNQLLVNPQFVYIC